MSGRRGGLRSPTGGRRNVGRDLARAIDKPLAEGLAVQHRHGRTDRGVEIRVPERLLDLAGQLSEGCVNSPPRDVLALRLASHLKRSWTPDFPI